MPASIKISVVVGTDPIIALFCGRREYIGIKEVCETISLLQRTFISFGAIYRIEIVNNSQEFLLTRYWSGDPQQSLREIYSTVLKLVMKVTI